MGKETISVMIPTYNEAENIAPLCSRIKELFQKELANYNYEIVVIDNFSTDATREILEELCAEDPNIKAIFNAANFGQIRSPFHGILQTSGACTVTMCADFQDPPEMIPKFVREWENGYKIVIGVKHKSKENPIVYAVRTLYYKIMKKISDTDQIEHFTGFGLYDKKFIDVLQKLDDPNPYFRGIIGELGFRRKEVPFLQEKRRGGKSKNNFFSLYDYAMVGITSYSKTVMRLATFIGFIIGVCSFLLAIAYLILKLLFWNSFPMGTAPILIGCFFLGALQLCFIGLLGEYIVSINTRVMKRPLVVEERRINFKENG